MGVTFEAGPLAFALAGQPRWLSPHVSSRTAEAVSPHVSRRLEGLFSLFEGRREVDEIEFRKIAHFADESWES
jgi:hypothetical protein